MREKLILVGTSYSERFWAKRTKLRNVCAPCVLRGVVVPERGGFWAGTALRWTLLSQVEQSILQHSGKSA